MRCNEVKLAHKLWERLANDWYNTRPMAWEGSQPWYCLKWQNPEPKDLGCWDRTRYNWSKNCPNFTPPLGSTLGSTALEALLDARVVLGSPGLTRPTACKKPLKPLPITTHYTSLPGFHTWVHTHSSHLGGQATPKNLVLGTPNKTQTTTCKVLISLSNNSRLHLVTTLYSLTTHSHSPDSIHSALPYSIS